MVLGEGVFKRLGHEGENIMNGTGALMKGTPESSLTAGILILDFQASRTTRNKYLLFKPPCLQYFLIAARTD